MYTFPDLEPVCCSMSSSNCCFLTCIQISQEAGELVWYSHPLKNFPHISVIHTVKDFGIVNKAEVDVFLELLDFLLDSEIEPNVTLLAARYPTLVRHVIATKGSSMPSDSHSVSQGYIMRNAKPQQVQEYGRNTWT